MDTITTQNNYIVVPPTTPNDKSTTRKISRMLADLEEIKEAHLPSIIEFGESTQAKPALFLLVTDSCDKNSLHTIIDQKLNGGFFRRKTIAVKLIDEDFPLLQSIRDAQCLIGWRD
jgi:hypothetical protein